MDNLETKKMNRLAELPLVLALGLIISLTIAGPAAGLTRIRDIARPWGERTNKLIGMGLVVGLSGTGDSSGSLVTMRSVTAFVSNLGAPISPEEELKSKNAAVVMVTAQLGRNGVREGDKINVAVASVGDAKSLEGGMLSLTPLQGANPDDDTFIAWASGQVTIPDLQRPTSGIVKNGADLETDFFHNYVRIDPATGRSIFTIVLDEEQANFQVAKAIAMLVNEEVAPTGAELFGGGSGGYGEPAAIPLGPRNIQVTIPAKQAVYPALFLARILDLPIDLPDPEAVVVVNEKTGVIAITGNVEIAPVTVHVNGMMIRIVEPQPQPRPGQPVITETEWSTFNTINARGVKIAELTDTLDQLNVPVQAKINALYEIQNAGALRARIISR